MAQPPRGESREPGLVAKSDVANTVVILEANPVTKALKVETQTIDVEIGAVEIKNSTDDTRATVGANGLHVDIQSSASDITGIVDGVTVVTTAGTDVVLAASTACKRVIVQAQLDNTSTIAVGATGVDGAVVAGTGIILYPGDAIDFEIDNLADIYIDSLVNGEGVRWVAFT